MNSFTFRCLPYKYNPMKRGNNPYKRLRTVSGKVIFGTTVFRSFRLFLVTNSRSSPVCLVLSFWSFSNTLKNPLFGHRHKCRSDRDPPLPGSSESRLISCTGRDPFPYFCHYLYLFFSVSFSFSRSLLSFYPLQRRTHYALY